jgi:ABC-type multidrug transport system ATPase subunit
MQTTGMDPVTRRHVWDIIEASKKGRAIVLTTHSMARGKLRCIGTPIRLKTRFGAGYVVNVSVRSENSTRDPAQLAEEEQRRSKVKQFFKEV